MKRPALMLLGAGTLVCARLLLPGHGPVGAACASPMNPGVVPVQTRSVACTIEKASAPAVPPDFFSSSPIFDGEARIPERLSAVARLGQDLSRDQISRLYDFLKALPGPEERNLAALNLLKNNIVCRLQDQVRPPAGLTATLIEVYLDRAQDPVARDYALQHLITWHEQGAVDAPDAKLRIQSVLRQAAQEQTCIAGTALLGLHRLNTGERQAMLLGGGNLLQSAGIPLGDGPTHFPAGGAINDDEISQTALRMLAATNLPCASRITAIQVCAEREVAQALPAIQTLAQTEDNTALQISAIAALGWLGGPEQVALLQRLEAEQNQPLKPAIEGALRRLQARLLRNPALTQNSL
jgi:HEAT repeats